MFILFSQKWYLKESEFEICFYDQTIVYFGDYAKDPQEKYVLCYYYVECSVAFSQETLVGYVLKDF